MLRRLTAECGGTVNNHTKQDTIHVSSHQINTNAIGLTNQKQGAETSIDLTLVGSADTFLDKINYEGADGNTCTLSIA